MTLIDVTVIAQDGKLVMHDPDCVLVSIARRREELVMTMFGCQPSIVADYPRHECLKLTTGSGGH